MIRRNSILHLGHLLKSVITTPARCPRWLSWRRVSSRQDLRDTLEVTNWIKVSIRVINRENKLQIWRRASNWCPRNKWKIWSCSKRSLRTCLRMSFWNLSTWTHLRVLSTFQRWNMLVQSFKVLNCNSSNRKRRKSQTPRCKIGTQ